MVIEEDRIAEEIAGFLRGRFPAAAAADIGRGTPLLTSGILDSLGILELALFLEERAGIPLEDENFEVGNFQTFGHLLDFVERNRAR